MSVPYRAQCCFALAIFVAVGLLMRGGQSPVSDVPESVMSVLGIVAQPENATVKSLPGGGPSIVDFTLKNIGNSPVVVMSVTTSCGCSVAQPMVDQTIRPGHAQSLSISVTPPSFGNRAVQVGVLLKDSNREEMLKLHLKLVGKPLAALRVYDLPPQIEVSSSSPGESVRLFEFSAVEDDADHPWITGFSSTSPHIKAEILSSSGIPKAGGGIQRTYSCRLTAEVPQSINDIVAAWVRLTAGESPAAESAVFRVIVHRRVAWKAFPSVLNFPALNATESSIQSVTIQAVDDQDAESLARLEIADVPESVTVEWEPLEERRTRRLSVKYPMSNQNSVPESATISLRDPQSLDTLTIHLVRAIDES